MPVSFHIDDVALAGLIGFEQDLTTLTLRPALGWAVGRTTEG